MIIGLLGYAGSGKDSVADILVKEHGFERRAFADKIREFLYDLDPQVQIGYDTTTTVKLMVDHGGWDETKQNPIVRKLLQDVGMSARNIFGQDFWVDQALKSMNSYKHYVITDVRFINEADRLRFFGARLWRIKRSGVGPINNHISETQLDGYKVDQILNNQGTLEDLKELVNTRIII